MKAIVIGRHQPDLGNEVIDIVRQEDVLFPATSEECVEILKPLFQECESTGAALLFQNTPGQVAATLVGLALQATIMMPKTGIVISVPAPAKESEARKFVFSHIEWVF